MGPNKVNPVEVANKKDVVSPKYGMGPKVPKEEENFTLGPGGIWANVRMKTITAMLEIKGETTHVKEEKTEEGESQFLSFSQPFRTRLIPLIE